MWFYYKVSYNEIYDSDIWFCFSTKVFEDDNLNAFDGFPSWNLTEVLKEEINVSDRAPLWI